jgi:parallel beta-helix repeat protein
MVLSGAPAAFMSYVRFNDQHDDGQLSEFRDRLAAEVRAQTGREFAIFQDRNDIAWGQNWQQRIDEALDAVTLLVVIITPSLFNSPACREEVTRFLDRERALGRADLIMPVYYIGTQELDDPVARESDKMAAVLASRQFADWRELRFESFTSPPARKAIAQLASRMREVFRQAPAAQARPASRTEAAKAAEGAEGAEAAQASETAGGPDRVTAKTEPPTHVVDAFPGRGNFTTVSAAIMAAQPGDRILVRPGLYEEGLVMDKPLEILGDGPVSDIDIRVRDAPVLVFRASIGRVANLTLRQAGGEKHWFGVDITQGRLDLEGCDISSQSGSCVAIRNGADPRLRRNQIHGSGKGDGVLVSDSGLGTLEDNDIAGNALSGVEISGGNPTLRRNQIHDNHTGVLVSDNGLGTLEDNDIAGNALSGVTIRTGGNPAVRGNRIHGNKKGGVVVSDNGLGTLEDNDIAGNSVSGVAVRVGGSPTLRRNRINRNDFSGVYVFEGGRGVVEDNDLTGNKAGAYRIADDSKGNVTLARNKE